MASRGRSRPFRALLTGFATVVALVASSAGTEAASSQFEIAVTPGYHQAVKLGTWMPVSVDITNRGQEFDGTIEIDATTASPGKSGPPAGLAVYQTPLSLAPGATKHLRTYLTNDYPGSIDVRIVASGGNVLQSAQTSIATTVPGLLVGVLSDDPTALDNIATIHPGGVSPTVVHLSSVDLPDSAVILRGFDVIALDDFSTDTLTAAQRSALVDYVMQGGSLLLSTGGSWRKTLAGLPEAIQPMKVSGSTVLSISPTLGGVASVEVAIGSLAVGAVAWRDERGLPLLVESAVGAGFVEMATFDWAQGSVVASSDADVLLRQTVVRSTYGGPNGLAAASLSGSRGGFGSSVASRGGTLSQALGNVPALDLPAWWLIGTLVFVYVLLVGPVNYLVLRAVRRRVVAWITIPTIAIIASGGAYGASVLTRGTSAVANEITILHAQPGWDRVYTEQYTGIVTPTRGDFEIGIGSHGPMISPIDYFSNPGNGSFGALRIDTATGAIAMPAMTAFTLRGFATEDIGTAPTVAGSAEFSGGQFKGSVRNGSSITFSDGVVLSGGASQKLGRLEPGGTLSFAVTPGASMIVGPPPYMQVYPNNLCCSGPSGNSPEVERLNEIRSSILSTVANANTGPIAVSATPTIVLWTQQPFENVTVNGVQPHAYLETAVVLNPPMGQFGSGAIPAGVINARLVDVDATLAPAGPPGILTASSGSMIFAFTPTLATGRRLQSVNLNSSNPYGTKFGPSGTSVPAVLNAQVWDWTRSQWIDVTYVDSGTTAVPGDAVNAITGEVRLKLSSDGQFTTAFLSISGTVS